MDIQYARVFQALVMEGTMLGAAKRLNITQPAISASLASFERELGVSLFHRSRRGLRMTQHGEALLPRIRELVDVADGITQYGKKQSSDSGVLRVSGRQGFMQHIFPILREKLVAQYPKISIEYALSGNQEDVVSALQTGRVDLCFAASPKIKSITAEVFSRDPVWFAVAKEHPLATKKKITENDLTKYGMILPSKSDRLRNSIDIYLRKLKKRPDVIFETNDYTLIRNVIEEGKYVGFIYGHMLASDAKHHRIVPLAIPGFDLVRELTILHRRDDIAPHVQSARDLFVWEAKKLLDDVVTKYKV